MTQAEAVEDPLRWQEAADSLLFMDALGSTGSSTLWFSDTSRL